MMAVKLRVDGPDVFLDDPDVVESFVEAVVSPLGCAVEPVEAVVVDVVDDVDDEAVGAVDRGARVACGVPDSEAALAWRILRSRRCALTSRTTGMGRANVRRAT